MKLKKLVVSLFPFFLLLLINVAYAQEDFTASTLPTVELCPCSNQAYAVTVQNTGQIPNSYIVIASGDASGWVNVQPSKFTLQPGAAGSFNVIVNSACNIKGNVDLELFITTNNGLTKLVKQVLKITKQGSLVLYSKQTFAAPLHMEIANPNSLMAAALQPKTPRPKARPPRTILIKKT